MTAGDLVVVAGRQRCNSAIAQYARCTYRNLVWGWHDSRIASSATPAAVRARVVYARRGGLSLALVIAGGRADCSAGRCSVLAETVALLGTPYLFW